MEISPQWQINFSCPVTGSYLFPTGVCVCVSVGGGFGSPDTEDSHSLPFKFVTVSLPATWAITCHTHQADAIKLQADNLIHRNP